MGVLFVISQGCQFKLFMKMLQCAAVLSLFTALVSQLSTAYAQGTAFMYQGQLATDGSLANGTYDVEFTLYAANMTGAPIAGPVTNSTTAVSNGLFSAMVDFGPGVFTGTNCWLDIAVRTNGSATFTELTPRQPITPTPYAIFANTANNVNGTVSGNGSGLTGLNPANLSAGSAGINISGNAATATTATNVTGNIADSQLSANVAFLAGTNNFTGTNSLFGVTLATNANNVFNGSFTGNGSGLTNVSGPTKTCGSLIVSFQNYPYSPEGGGNLYNTLVPIGQITINQSGTSGTYLVQYSAVAFCSSGSSQWIQIVAVVDSTIQSNGGAFTSLPNGGYSSLSGSFLINTFSSGIHTFAFEFNASSSSVDLANGNYFNGFSATVVRIQ